MTETRDAWKRDEPALDDEEICDIISDVTRGGRDAATMREVATATMRATHEVLARRWMMDTPVQDVFESTKGLPAGILSANAITKGLSGRDPATETLLMMHRNCMAAIDSSRRRVSSHADALAHLGRVYKWFVTEYAADPDTGLAVEKDATRPFEGLCEMIDFLCGEASAEEGLEFHRMMGGSSES